MKKTFNLHFILAIILLDTVLISCSDKKVSILYNSKFATEHKVVIDDTLTLEHNISHEFSTLILSSGKHKLKIDTEPEKEFKVIDDGDILNIASEEFVIYPIKFSLGEDKWGSSSGLPNLLLIDSFAVVSEMYLKFHPAPLTKSKALKASNGSEKTELLKIDKSQLYIPKNWDYDMSQRDPKAIKENMSEKTTQATIFRKKILPAKQFLKLANGTANGFIAIPLSNMAD
jgi:hypothetical protein